MAQKSTSVFYAFISCLHVSVELTDCSGRCDTVKIKREKSLNKNQARQVLYAIWLGNWCNHSKQMDQLRYPFNELKHRF